MSNLDDYAGHGAAQIYRYHRQRCTPAAALQATRVNLIAGTSRYPKCSNKAGAPFGSSRLRWIERPEDAGFRFVGFADEIAGRAIDHTGWYTHPDGDFGGTLRGAIYQLPARRGRARYVAGYQEIGFGSEGAALALGEIFTGEPGGMGETPYRGRYASTYGDTFGAHRDAAFRADRIAEIYAEREREYQEACQQAARWEEAAEDMKRERAAARQLVHDMRQAIKAGLAAAPSICNALRSELRRRLDRWEELREERRDLADNFHYERQDIAEFAAGNL